MIYENFVWNFGISIYQNNTVILEIMNKIPTSFESLVQRCEPYINKMQVK